MTKPPMGSVYVGSPTIMKAAGSVGVLITKGSRYLSQSVMKGLATRVARFARKLLISSCMA